MTDQIETPFHGDPMEYDVTEDENGVLQAVNPLNSILVLPDGNTRIFKRRAIKGVGGSNVTFESCLIAELDGVRVYLRGNSIVVTKQDLQL